MISIQKQCETETKSSSWRQETSESERFNGVSAIQHFYGNVASYRVPILNLVSLDTSISEFLLCFSVSNLVLWNSNIK